MVKVRYDKILKGVETYETLLKVESDDPDSIEEALAQSAFDLDDMVNDESQSYIDNIEVIGEMEHFQSNIQDIRRFPYKGNQYLWVSDIHALFEQIEGRWVQLTTVSWTENDMLDIFWSPL
jgi:hypothetical protein